MQLCWRRDGFVGLNRSGFSILELIIVLVVIVVLLALIVPAISLSKNAMRQLHCAANTGKLGTAATLYAIDHDGLLPLNYVRSENGSIQDWQLQLSSYINMQNRGVARVASQQQIDLKEIDFACPDMNTSKAKNKLGYAQNAFTSSNAWQPYDGSVVRQRELYLQLHPEMKFSPAYGWYRTPLRLADLQEPSKTFRMTDSNVKDLSVKDFRSATGRHGYRFGSGGMSLNMLYFDGHVSLIEKRGMRWDKPRSRWWLPYEGY
ncbi:prepilin-type N-terminal cleavage/methylation domain-containing protein [Poriferisphaera corsica]|nr:prepilin-type N-terminal cleavage/methylation domain-containing protein [Poriferisphaera corsica]